MLRATGIHEEHCKLVSTLKSMTEIMQINDNAFNLFTKDLIRHVRRTC
jgi:hypothetical protein